MFNHLLQTPIITSAFVPEYKSFMWMALPRFLRFPWQKRYLVHELSKTWYGMYWMSKPQRAVVCHPSDYDKIKRMLEHE